MICKTYAAACIGLNVVTVTVETDISGGVGLYIVGMPDIAVKESLMRITTALRSYGYSIPGKRIVINLAPADIRKEAPFFTACSAPHPTKRMAHTEINIRRAMYRIQHK